jgi:hypothetical protein
MSDLVRLTQVPREIASLSGGETVPYRHLYGAAVDAQIPTVYIRGRHYAQRNDLPAIAAHFGIVLARATERATAA